MTVAERVKTYIDEKSISQKELSNGTGISQSAISLLLRGGRKLECDEFSLIIGYLNVPADKFIKPKKILERSD